MDQKNVAVEHIAGPLTPTDWQRCLRCHLLLACDPYFSRQLIPIYEDYFNDINGRFKPYEPVWIFDGAIWPVSPDPEKVKIVFCGGAN